jgi:hypothetical protein
LQQEGNLQREKSFGCGNFSVIGPLKGQFGKFGYKCLFCQSYRCNRCRNPKLKKVRARIAEIATEHKLQRMVTLTLDPKRTPKGRTDRYIRECWREMRVLLSRKFKGSISFLGVLEFQKNGMAHLHVLVGRFIQKTWLSRAWKSVGGGQIVDIKWVDVHRVSAYLSVYLAGDKVKQTLSLLAKRARIFTTSRSIVLWGKKEKCGWRLVREDIGVLLETVDSAANLRFEAVEDLKPFNLEMLSYFESPPNDLVFGNDFWKNFRAAIQAWNQVSSSVPGDAVKN